MVVRLAFPPEVVKQGVPPALARNQTSRHCAVSGLVLP